MYCFFPITNGDDSVNNNTSFNIYDMFGNGKKITFTFFNNDNLTEESITTIPTNDEKETPGFLLISLFGLAFLIVNNNGKKMNKK